MLKARKTLDQVLEYTTDQLNSTGIPRMNFLQLIWMNISTWIAGNYKFCKVIKANHEAALRTKITLEKKLKEIESLPELRGRLAGEN